jgi:hypothetical protein
MPSSGMLLFLSSVRSLLVAAKDVLSPVRYELGVYIPEYGILHSHSRENLKSYTVLTGWTLQRRRNVFSVRYEVGVHIPEYGILHSHRRENLNSYIFLFLSALRYPGQHSCTALLLVAATVDYIYAATRRSVPLH